MKIALDVAGGDYGFAPNLEGLRYAMDDQDVEKFLLVGPVDEMKAELSKYDLSADDPRLEFVQASQVVEMHEPSSIALRKKRDSSVTVAATLEIAITSILGR